jgi:hypothetical protein
MAALIFGILMFVIVRAAAIERTALENPYQYAVIAAILAAVALLLRYRTKIQANFEGAALQFDDPPEPAVLSLWL